MGEAFGTFLILDEWVITPLTHKLEGSKAVRETRAFVGHLLLRVGHCGPGIGVHRSRGKSPSKSFIGLVSNFLACTIAMICS